MYPIQAGVILGDRYRILSLLGQGGFGRTYLATDTNRFNETCVLKEFAPKVQGTYALQKAVELFEREAGVLYKLQHPQIPKFRELLRVTVQGQSQLFLVQDYIEGKTYRQLLDLRKLQGQNFSEVEVTQLLLQLLPVLEYIHSVGVIHRDISPDNLMLRSQDGKPILIDFGGVKQVAATVEFQYTQAHGGSLGSVTRLGKTGYAPNEQMLAGDVQPYSDLYALAATALVLLTGKEPQQLIEPTTMQWNWRRFVTLSPQFSQILDKMLAFRPGDRFARAQDVLAALTGQFPLQTTPAQHHLTQPSLQSTFPPYPIPQTEATHAYLPPSPQSHPQLKQGLGWGGVCLFLIGAIAAAGGVGWWVTQQNLTSQPIPTPTPTVTPDPTPTVEPTTPPPSFSEAEQAQRRNLDTRLRELKVSSGFLTRWTDRQFYRANPQLGDRRLTSEPKDAELREQWYDLALENLEKLTILTDQTRQRLGQYNRSDLERLHAQINRVNLSSRTLNDLVDARFFEYFPEAEGQDLANQPLGQIWQAFAQEMVNEITRGNQLEKLTFEAGAVGKTVTGQLKPGEGKAYILQVLPNQRLKFSLEDISNTALLSIYPPSGQQAPIATDSSDYQWEVYPTQKGYYEIVIVNPSYPTLDYNLQVIAEFPNAVPSDSEPAISPFIPNSNPIQN